MPSPTVTPARNPDGLFGAPAPGRACGDCDACCITLGIADPLLAKAPGTPCHHLSGRGCGIHATRPATCRDWECLWKRSDVIPTEAQPNKCGVMFFFETQSPPRFVTEHGAFIGHSLTDDKAFESPAFRTAMDRLAQRFPYVPIWLSVGGQKSCVYPPPPLLEVIEGRSKDPRLLPTALLWIEGYLPLANASAGARSWFRDGSWRSRYVAPAAAPFQFGGPVKLT